MLRLVLGDATVLVIAGIAIGYGLSLACAKALTSFLSATVSVTDPSTLAAIVAILLVTGLAAAFVPARRALRVDPLTALREL